MLEKELQKQVVELLDSINCKNKIKTFFAVPNGSMLGGYNKFGLLSSMRKQGFRNGVSDLVVVGFDKVLFLELKVGKNKLSPFQEEFKECVNFNINTDTPVTSIYSVCYSVEEVKLLLEALGWL